MKGSIQKPVNADSPEGLNNPALEAAKSQYLVHRLVKILKHPLNTILETGKDGDLIVGNWTISRHELISGVPSHPLGFVLRTYEVIDDSSFRKLPIKIVARKSGEKSFEYVGIIFRKYSGEVFIARPAKSDLAQFAQDTLHMLQNIERYQVQDGELRYEWPDASQITDDTRENLSSVGIATYARLSKVGIHKRPELTETTAPTTLTLDIPGKILKSTTRRIRSVVTENDSFGKQQWRTTMGEKFHEIFPGGYESIPERDRLVLCFPGAGGREADFWMDQGFKEKDLVMIERDEKILAQLMRKYPKAAAIIKTNVGKDRSRFLDDIINDYRQILGRCRFSVVSFDPEGGITERFLNNMAFVFPFCANQFLLSANFYLKRESEEIVRIYQNVITAKSYEVAEADDSTRQLVMRHLPRYLMDRSPYNKIVNNWHGSYEGDSHATRMYWTMAHLKNKNDK